MPYLAPSGEQKTKPTQHSVTELRSRGIQPDVIVCRSDQPISDGLKRKISLLCDVPVEGVISAVDAPSIYEIPLVLHDEGLDRVVCQMLAIDGDLHPVDLSGWEKVVSQVSASERPVRIGVVGKYVNLPDAYLSVGEALRHAGFHHGAKVEVDWIQAEKVPDLLGTDRMLQLDGMVIPGGFGERGIEGKIDAVEFARRREIPCLGLCLGLQVMVIEVARHLAGLEGANSREFDTITPHPVIDLMDDQHNVVDMGGTMRLGSYVAQLEPGSKVADAYGTTVVSERHRHRYEVNPRYRAKLEDAGLRCSGIVGRRRARRVRRASRAPLLGGDPGPPGVQEPARPPPPAVPRAVGRGPAARRRAPAAPHRHRHRRRCRLLSRGSVTSPTRSASRGGGSRSCEAQFEAPDGTRFSARRRPPSRRGGRRARDRARHGAPRPPVPRARSTASSSRSPPAPATSRARHPRPRRGRELEEEVGVRAGSIAPPGHHPQQPRLLRRGDAPLPRPAARARRDRSATARRSATSRSSRSPWPTSTPWWRPESSSTRRPCSACCWPARSRRAGGPGPPGPTT